MSLRVEDPDRINASIGEVQSPSSSHRWVLCGRLKNSRDVLRFIKSGSGGLEEINASLQDDNLLAVYGLVKLDDSLVFVTWYYNTQFEKKLTSHSKEISVMFMPYQSWIHIDLKSNVSLKDILESRKYSNSDTKPTESIAVK